uniref:Integrase_H2C2 domain-containing protein n=1 Tax=Strongyloides venezuelensis TaxID=75913 RepID=A0A0K0FS24_STRVS
MLNRFPSKNEWLQLQINNKILKTVFTWLEDDITKKSPLTVLSPYFKNFYRLKTCKETGFLVTKCGKIAISPSFYPKLIELLYTNHIGEKAIIDRLQRRFFTPHITPIIQKCLDSCIDCKNIRPKRYLKEHPGLFVISLFKDVMSIMVLMIITVNVF